MSTAKQEQGVEYDYREILRGRVALPDNMTGSLAMFAKRLRTFIDDELAKPTPDTALLALLCDAARLGDEYLMVLGNKKQQRRCVCGHLESEHSFPNGCSHEFLGSDEGYECACKVFLDVSGDRTPSPANRTTEQQEGSHALQGVPESQVRNMPNRVTVSPTDPAPSRDSLAHPQASQGADESHDAKTGQVTRTAKQEQRAEWMEDLATDLQHLINRSKDGYPPRFRIVELIQQHAAAHCAAEQEKCRCNCHDAAARKAMNMPEHASCVDCANALIEESNALAKREAELKAEDAPRAAEQQGDPNADGTDAAHPAWWRGHDDGVRGAVMRIRDALSGKDDGAGVISDPELEALRREIIQPRAAEQGRERVGNGLDRAEMDRRELYDRAAIDLAARPASPEAKKKPSQSTPKVYSEGIAERAVLGDSDAMRKMLGGANEAERKTITLAEASKHALEVMERAEVERKAEVEREAAIGTPPAPDFARLRELLAKATPGPWGVQQNFRIYGHTSRANDHLWGHDAENNYSPEEIGQTFTIRKFTKERYHPIGQSDSYSAEAAAIDAELIVVMRNALPALLSRLEKAEGERERMREALIEFGEHCVDCPWR